MNKYIYKVRGRSRNFERGFFFGEFISHTNLMTFFVLTLIVNIYYNQLIKFIYE